MTNTNDRPKAPAHLTPATRKWWDVVVAEFELEAQHLKLLQAAAESWDRMQSARAVIDRDGISYLDRFGAPRSRPEVRVEVDSRIAFARLCRELRLDDANSPETPRPPGLKR